MSYIIHIIGMLDKAGAERNPHNKMLLDQSVREALGMQRADWQEVWTKVKAMMQSPNREKWKAFEAQVTKILVRKMIMS
jgi:hypothetical protein